jgi:hypothetical protein
LGHILQTSLGRINNDSPEGRARNRRATITVLATRRKQIWLYRHLQINDNLGLQSAGLGFRVFYVFYFQGLSMLTRKIGSLFVFVLLFACVIPAQAESASPPDSPVQLGVIREAQIRIWENRDAVKEGVLSSGAADARIARIVDRLNANLSTKLTEATLMEVDTHSALPSLSQAERRESFFEGVNFLRLGLIAVFTILTMMLIGKYMAWLIRWLDKLPKETGEIGACTIGFGLLAAQAEGFMAVNQFWAFFGCLLIGGGLGLSTVIHKHYFETTPRSMKLFAQYVIPVVMLVAFGAATLITGSNWMGGFAAMTLMALLGFAGEVIPFGYVIGFRDKDALARATSAALILMALFMGLHAAHISNSAIRAFEPGALVVGGFVGYLGLLIAGSNWYRRRQSWMVMQIIVLVFCFAGVLGGSVLGLKSIQIMAGVFLSLWTIEKMVEIPGNGFVPWVLKLMAASGTLYLLVTYGAPWYAGYLIA